jgi:hypothetical protein
LTLYLTMRFMIGSFHRRKPEALFHLARCEDDSAGPNDAVRVRQQDFRSAPMLAD